MVALGTCAFAQAPRAEPLPAWPAFYDPASVPSLNLKIRADDYERFLSSPSPVEVPALLWASQDGDERNAILVSVERLSDSPDAPLRFEVDVNAYVGEDARARSRWHELKSLTLVGGDARDVVELGFAWQLHRLASEVRVYPEGYRPRLANWATVSFHLAPGCAEPCATPFEFGPARSVRGGELFVDLETIDTRYFRNRTLWENSMSWVYRQREPGEAELKRPGCDPPISESPAVAALRCSPFDPSEGARACEPTELSRRIDMDVLLGMGAVDAFLANGDGMFGRGRGFFWIDSSRGAEGDACREVGRRRMYVPLAVGPAFGAHDREVPREAGSPDDAETAYRAVILGDERPGGFRERFDSKLLVLSDPRFVDSARRLARSIERALRSHVPARTARDSLDEALEWLVERSASIRSQLCGGGAEICDQPTDAFDPPARVIDTHLYPLRIVAVPLEPFRARGGAIDPIGRDLLFATPRGRLGIVSPTNTVRYLDARVPMNESTLESAPVRSDSRFDPRRFRVADLLARRISDDAFELFVSHHHFAADCIDFRISSAVLRLGAEGPSLSEPWRTVFVARPCRHAGEDFVSFGGHEVGGRMLLDGDEHLLIVIGDSGLHGRRPGEPKAALDPDYDYGKLLRVAIEDGSAKVLAQGLRNPQGFARDLSGELWETEHGPQGGDELNRLRRRRNYGWPEVTYGVDYGFERWPFNPVQGEHEGFEKPVFAWVPSIAVSNLIFSDSVQLPRWRGDALVASLKEATLYRLRMEDGRVVYVEPILLYERLRDVAEMPDGTVAILTDDAQVFFLERDTSYCDYAGAKHVYSADCEDVADRPRRPVWIEARGAGERSAASGEELFARECGDCHNLYPQHAIGPHLVDFLGKPAGSREGFGFSRDLRASDRVFSRDVLIEFVRDPQSFGRGVRMAPVDVSPEEAARIADFLESRRER